MQQFMKKAVLVSDGYSPNVSLTGVFHYAVHRRAQRRIAQIQFSRSPLKVIEVHATMRI